MAPFKWANQNEHIWSPNAEKGQRLMAYIIKGVFMIDLIIGFRKAYLNEHDGTEVRDPWKIARRYMKFYFWIDLISALPFDMIFNNSTVELLTMVKIIRLARLDKVISFMNFDTHARSRIRVTYRVLKLVIIIHWVTCMYGYEAYQQWHGLLHELKPNEKYVPWDYNYWIP